MSALMVLASVTLGIGAIALFRRWCRDQRVRPSPVVQKQSATTRGKLHYQPGVIYYRTKDGRADYGFSIERQPDGSYRAYIVSHPSYGRRDTSLHVTHRLQDGSRYYVCWTNRLETEQQARQVAALWADATQEYIKHGRRF